MWEVNPISSSSARYIVIVDSFFLVFWRGLSSLPDIIASRIDILNQRMVLIKELRSDTDLLKVLSNHSPTLSFINV